VQCSRVTCCAHRMDMRSRTGYRGGQIITDLSSVRKKIEPDAPNVHALVQHSPDDVSTVSMSDFCTLVICIGRKSNEAS
jgi:hypothetical protein